MKLLSIVPIASLILVTGVIVSAALYDPPLEFPYTERPEGGVLAAPDLGLGDVTLHGRVTDPSGVPVDGACVSLDQNGRPLFAWSMANGAFHIDELHSGAGTLRVTALGFQSTSFNVPLLEGTSASAPLELILDQPIGAPPPVSPLRLGDLAGRVAFGPHAEPSAGYELFFLPVTAPNASTGGFPRRVAVDPSGKFTVLRMHEGEYRAILLAAEDRGGRTPDLLSRSDGSGVQFTFEAGEELPSLDLTMTAGAVLGSAAPALRGALVRAERVIPRPVRVPDGRPPFVDRSINVDRSTFRATRTDATGGFVLRDLAPGRYKISLVAGLRRQERIVDVSPGGVIDLVFEPK